jgi:TPR repeat protein
MSTHGTVFASVAPLTSLVVVLCGLAGLVAWEGCGWSRVDGALAVDCTDGDGCLKQVRSLLGDDAASKPAAVRARAVVLYQKGCDLGGVPCCRELGGWLEDSGLAPRDLPRSARLYERGCSLKDGFACQYLFRLYHDGRGVPYDPVRAAKYRQLACHLVDATTDDYTRGERCTNWDAR